MMYFLSFIFAMAEKLNATSGIYFLEDELLQPLGVGLDKRKFDAPLVKNPAVKTGNLSTFPF